MRNRAPDLQGPPRPAHLAELSMCLSKGRDGLATGPEPPVEREGLGIRHGHIDIFVCPLLWWRQMAPFAVRENTLPVDPPSSAALDGVSRHYGLALSQADV